MVCNNIYIYIEWYNLDDSYTLSIEVIHLER